MKPETIPAAPRSGPMAPSTSRFWSEVVVAVRDRRQRIDVACAGVGVLMLVMIAGRVGAAWIGGAL